MTPRSDRRVKQSEPCCIASDGTKCYTERAIEGAHGLHHANRRTGPAGRRNGESKCVGWIAIDVARSIGETGEVYARGPERSLHLDTRKA